MGEDRYVWAYKTHFYRTRPVFYDDWQYTLVFRFAALAISLSKDGTSAFRSQPQIMGLTAPRFPANDLRRNISVSPFASQAYSFVSSRPCASGFVTRFRKRCDYFLIVDGHPSAGEETNAGGEISLL